MTMVKISDSPMIHFKIKLQILYMLEKVNNIMMIQRSVNFFSLEINVKVWCKSEYFGNQCQDHIQTNDYHHKEQNNSFTRTIADCYDSGKFIIYPISPFSVIRFYLYHVKSAGQSSY